MSARDAWIDLQDGGPRGKCKGMRLSEKYSRKGVGENRQERVKAVGFHVPDCTVLEVSGFGAGEGHLDKSLWWPNSLKLCGEQRKRKGRGR